MASNTTTYDVLIKLVAKDQASEQAKKVSDSLAKIAKQSKDTQTRVDGLANSLKRAVLALGLFKIAQKTVGSAIFENIDAQRLQRQLTTNIQMSQGVGRSTAKQWTSQIMKGLRDEEVNLAGLLIDPIADAGGKLKDVNKLAHETFMAAKAFGISEEESAETVSKALRGNLSSRDKMGRLMFGMDPDVLNKMSPEKRMAQVKKALGGGAVKEGFKDFENSFDGTVDKIKHTWFEFLEDAGKPLFTELSKGLKQLAEWMKNNGKTTARWAKDLGESLVRGFKVVMSALRFVKENAKILIAIFAGFKAASLASSIQAAGGLGKALSGVSEGLGSFAGQLNLAIAGLGLLALGANAIANSILNDQQKRAAQTLTGNTQTRDILAVLGNQTKTYLEGRGLAIQISKSGIEASAADEVKRQHKMGMGATRESVLSEWGLRGAVRSGLYNPKRGTVDMSQIAQMFDIGGDARKKVGLGEAIQNLRARSVGTRAYDSDTADRLDAALNTLNGLSEAISQNLIGGNTFLDNLAKAAAIVTGKPTKGSIATDFAGSGAKINVARVEIKVASDDPDRFAMGLEGIFLDAVKNPSQAASARRES
jgi:hypothetical protein